MSPLVRAERGRREDSPRRHARDDDAHRQPDAGASAAPPAESDEEPVDAGTLFTATLIASRSPKPLNPDPEAAGGWTPPHSQLHLRDRLV
jgi:hypothetical protein